MKHCLPALARGVAAVLVCALLGTSAFAKPVNPETIHRKIVQRGMGAWVCIEEANGVLLLGRITNIDEQSFGMQLEDYPEITTVRYDQVVKLRNYGLSDKAAIAWIAAGAGGAVALALIAHHEMSNFQNHQPTLPTTPPYPGYPGVN